VAADLAWAWLRQARADLSAAARFHDSKDDSTACQAVAKHQQTVEKSVKAIVAAVDDRGIMSIQTGFSHDVERLISALMHLPRRPGNRDIQNRINGLFNEHHRGEIKAICLLAPQRPGPRRLAGRNTEYPYQNPDGSWRAPADPGSFDRKDVERFRLLATRVCDGSARVVSAVYR
jgi:HEPN domain-containing protein